MVDNEPGVGIGAKQGKVGVVGHSITFRVYNSQPEYWSHKYCLREWDHYPCADMSYQMMNCELYPDQTILHEQQIHLREYLKRIFLWQGVPGANLV